MNFCVNKNRRAEVITRFIVFIPAIAIKSAVPSDGVPLPCPLSAHLQTEGEKMCRVQSVEGILESHGPLFSGYLLLNRAEAAVRGQHIVWPQKSRD